MNNKVSDCDTISMDGNLFDVALGSDQDGLMDNEIITEIGGLTDEDDNVNVTIRETARMQCWTGAYGGI